MSKEELLNEARNKSKYQIDMENFKSFNSLDF